MVQIFHSLEKDSGKAAAGNVIRNSQNALKGVGLGITFYFPS